MSLLNISANQVSNYEQTRGHRVSQIGICASQRFVRLEYYLFHEYCSVQHASPKPFMGRILKDCITKAS